MKRPLLNEEVDKLTKSLEVEKKHLSALKDSLWYLEETLKQQKLTWEYEDKVKDYTRNRDIEKFNKALAETKPQIEWSERSIENMEDQIKNGVEVKEIKEVEIDKGG